MQNVTTIQSKLPNGDTQIIVYLAANEKPLLVLRLDGRTEWVSPITGETNHEGVIVVSEDIS
jgi:hypothetical protein